MKYIIFLLSITLTSLIYVAPTYAECTLGDPTQGSTTASPTEFLQDCARSSSAIGVGDVQGGNGKERTRALVIKVAERAIQFGALFAVGMIVFAGIRYIVSAGDDEKLKGAKNTAITALIGLILLGIAFPLVDVIIGFFYSLGSNP